MLPLLIATQLAGHQIDFDVVETPELTPSELRSVCTTKPSKCPQYFSDGYPDDDAFVLGANWISSTAGHGYLQNSSQGDLGDKSHYLAMRFVLAGEANTWDQQIELNWSGRNPASLKWMTPDEKNPNASPSATTYYRCKVK